jgi:hypothetical protein
LEVIQSNFAQFSIKDQFQKVFAMLINFQIEIYVQMGDGAFSDASEPSRG